MHELLQMGYMDVIKLHWWEWYVIKLHLTVTLDFNWFTLHCMWLCGPKHKVSLAFWWSCSREVIILNTSLSMLKTKHFDLSMTYIISHLQHLSLQVPKDHLDGLTFQCLWIFFLIKIFLIFSLVEVNSGVCVTYIYSWYCHHWCDWMLVDLSRLYRSI